MLSPREATQQRIAQAQANAAAARPQESDGKSASSGPGAPRSFLGGNLEVYSALEKIGFQGVLGDASMRGNTAYIRIWKRAGTSQQQSSSATPVSKFSNDASEQIAKDINDTFGEERERLGDNQFIEQTAGENSYRIITGNVERDDDGNIIGDGTIETRFFQPDLDRQKALATQTPATSVTQTSETNTIPPQTPSQPTTDNNAALGTVRSANPNGFINTLGRIGRAVIGLPQGKPDYVGGAEASVTSAPLGEMMWQFLFNPSELELETGPEFKGAETWGVSDKANSGQPLHWTHNKNTQLKFNSVLLNGFVFGRKVEVLEQGLIELFMARDGAGQHGPHVLEFVWGKRSFGPCVIKNINIKEKMWDEGEVVNAELSFTLEQVPEWTINDGAYVDVARPGRRPLQEEATSQPTQSNAPSGSDTSPGSGGKESDQKSKIPLVQKDFVACKNLQKLQTNAKTFNPSVGKFSGGGRSRPALYSSNFDSNFSKYTGIVTLAERAGIKTSGKCAPREINKTFADLAFYKGQRRDASTTQRADKDAALTMDRCAEDLGNRVRDLYRSSNCSRFQANPNSNTERL